MSSAVEYNAAQMAAGLLTPELVTEAIRFWQEKHGLEVDGMAGPITLESLAKAAGPVLWLANPIPILRSRFGRAARYPHVTSAFRSKDRPDHDGVDLFYRWETGDQPDFVGDRGCAGKTSDGKPKWVIPYGTHAIAAAAGRVSNAGNSPTGYRVWIDHANGMRTGYFHLLDVKVVVGEEVEVGRELGLVGDNPRDHDGRHLHFELSPVDRYTPVDPVPFMYPSLTRRA